jgi:archaellum component FlaC
MAGLQGLKIMTNFKAVEVEFDGLINHINNAIKQPFNLNININQIQNQIQQVASKVSQASQQIENNVGNGFSNRIQSDSEKLIKAVEQAQRSLNISLQNLQTKYGNLLPQNEVANLKNAIDTLDAADMGSLRTNVKDIRLDMSQMTANARDSSKALRLANQDAKSLSSTLASDVTKFALWYAIGNLVTAPLRAINDAAKSVVELDDTINDLNMDMMNTSQNAFDGLITSSRNLSISL